MKTDVKRLMEIAGVPMNAPKVQQLLESGDSLAELEKSLKSALENQKDLEARDRGPGGGFGTRQQKEIGQKGVDKLKKQIAALKAKG